MLTATFLLQAQQHKGADWSFFVMMGLLMVVFYFFMIRPQQKKAKDAKKFRESLQKGTKVVTIGGLHGKVVEVADSTILLEVDSNVRLRFEKSAIAMDSSQHLNEATAKAQ
ncbi:MAG TPA: preprotein translocase subunit YajC [Flavobacteriales bacterium]|nr:preprotein translocase subunit YajC [Flavobacteriales bacterium]HNU56686.1 preprotein translocase subunit YajC [Flavobacteriales bacterium]